MIGALVLIVSGLCAVFLGESAEAARGRISRVVIDAGHGGHDSGARRGYVLEKHLALDVSRRLERYLERRGMRCIQTRDRDTFLPLSQRSKIANRQRNAVFVSVHFNWAYNSASTGTETFYHSNSALASAIQSRVARKAGTPNRGVKRARFYVLRHTDIPSALVECGFISNFSDRRRCLDPRYRQKMAEAIGEGILSYSRS
ncbi:MAG: N-acetylmuramoyl-L-alanine amidase [Verrucomicrobiales bacterium]|jgi:N-acetylmuramoyl-L-alanine amidase